jgi:plastocyanin
MNTTIDNFDSRALRHTDAYGQRFMREGVYRYDLVTAGAGEMFEFCSFTINVVGGDKIKKMKQHTVTVSFKDNVFLPDDPEITIKEGDMVMWCCRQPSAPPFEVIGEKEFFSSAKMVNECGYAHAFGSPGTYQWSNLSDGKLSGVVKVIDPQCKTQADVASWKKKLSTGSLVMINEGKATPSEVEILTGQTVYFAVIKSDGISITDQRSVHAADAVNQVLHGQNGC